MFEINISAFVDIKRYNGVSLRVTEGLARRRHGNRLSGAKFNAQVPNPA